MRPNKPNMEELLNKKSTKITRVQNEPLWISKTDLEYTYGQLKLSDETSKRCNFAETGRIVNGYYRFIKGFHGLLDVSKTLQKNRQTTQIPNTRVAG